MNALKTCRHKSSGSSKAKSENTFCCLISSLILHGEAEVNVKTKSSNTAAASSIRKGLKTAVEISFMIFKSSTSAAVSQVCMYFQCIRSLKKHHESRWLQKKAVKISFILHVNPRLFWPMFALTWSFLSLINAAQEYCIFISSSVY